MKAGKELWDDPQARDEYVETRLWSQEAFRDKFYHLEYEDLPTWAKVGMEMSPKRGVRIAETRVVERVWAPGDTYLVVSEIQVREGNGFKKGDRVKVTIENLRPLESKARKDET